MTDRRPRAAAVALGVVLGLAAAAGCSAGGPAAGTPVAGGSSTSPPGGASADPTDLAAWRAEAGLERCPTPDPDATAAPPSAGLPDLTLECLGDGPAVRLATQRGPLLLNLWASWCPPCRQEIPLLRDFAAAERGRVRVVGVDMVDEPAAALSFLAGTGATYPSVQDRDGATRGPLGVAALPVTLFVDADGRVAYRHIGALSSVAQLRGLVAEHLGVPAS